MKRKSKRKLSGFITLLLWITVCGGAVYLILYYALPSSAISPTPGPKKEETEKIISIPNDCQYPHLPTGCEAVAAAMVLRYYGEPVTAEIFASGWLDQSKDFYYWDGVLHGPDPQEFFLGDPFSAESYGCYAAPVVRAVEQHAARCRATEIRGRTLASLCTEYIDRDKPLLVWVTMNMAEPYDGRSWVTPTGETFTWISGEHCMVLVGYDQDHFYFNDPQKGETVSYDRELSEKRFEALGYQAVFISPA